MIFPKEHISYSSVNKYLDCPQKWYYDYVIAKDKKETSTALTLGSVYHEALEKLYLDGDYEGGLALFSQLASDSGRFAQKGIEMLRKCYENYYMSIYPQYQSRVEKVEVKDQISVPGIPIPLEYRMDLLTTDGVIIDHKTVGRMVPNIDYSLQFDLYAYAYYRMNGVLPSRVEYHIAYKDSGRVEVVGKVPRLCDMLRAISCVVGAYRGVENDIFYCKCGKQCNYCSHRELCESENGNI